MNKTIFFLFLVFCFSHPIAGQEVIDIPEWVSLRMQSLGWNESEMRADGFKASWIREMEFRTETEDFEFPRQEYLLRFSPSTPGIRRAQSQLIELAKEESGVNQMDFRIKLARSVLEELVEIRAVTEELKLQRRLLAVYEDERKLAGNRAAEGEDYDVRALLQTEAGIQDLLLEIKSNEYRLQALAGDGPLPADSQLLPAPAIAEKLESVDWAGQENAGSWKGRLDRAQLDAEMKLEKAEQNRIIDFVQMRYNGPHTDIFQERINVSLGFDLPHSAGKKMKLEELRVEQLLLEQELRHQKTLDSLKLLSRIKELRARIEEWKLHQEKLDGLRAQWQALRERGIDAAYDAPEAYLFQQEALLKAQLKILGLENDIYRAYFNLLEQSGVLGRERSLPYILSFVAPR